MPLFDYRCDAGHTVERLRKYEARDEPLTCDDKITLTFASRGPVEPLTCGLPMHRILSAPHVEPDGVYSHEPNLGSKDAFDRKYEANKAKRR